MILVTYTTQYRTGGRHLAQAAHTLAAELRAGGAAVRCVATETKRAFVDAALAQPLDGLHMVGHAGLYGPMFGTTDLPEQLSPHEWRTLGLRFTPGAEAFFHCCRSGRWFAPFFARTFGVVAHGHHWYTTVSRAPDKYRWAPSWLPQDRPLYVVGQRGRRSHGLLGSVGKHNGLLPPTKMGRFEPEPTLARESYDRVAARYDRVFDDIRVRAPEWAWLSERVPAGADLLDLGCGTGSLLRALDDREVRGVGVDASAAMLAHAARRSPKHRWEQISGPSLPLADNSVDVVTSLLSWRYLDWDPMLAEVARVLRPGGRLLVVDMCATPAAVREWPTVLAHKLRARKTLQDFPGVQAARDALVADPAWQEMLRYNPIRAEHEYRWFFASRFPEASIEVLDVGRSSRVLAVDSGPIDAGWFPPQSFP